MVTGLVSGLGTALSDILTAVGALVSGLL